MSYRHDINKLLISDAVCALTDLVLENDKEQEKVLRIVIRISASNYTTNKHHSCFIGLLLARRYNVTTVASYDIDSYSDIHNVTSKTPLKLYSSHSSCWRSGVEDAIRVHAEKIVDEIEKEIDVENYSIYNSFDPLASPQIIKGRLNVYYSGMNRNVEFVELD